MRRLLVFGLLAAASLSAANSFLIRRCTVFDGQRLLPPSDVLVLNGRIEAVGRHLKAPRGTPSIAGAGKTLLPGLIDSHVHVLSRRDLETAVAFGVTAVLDMFTYVDLAAAMRAEQKSGNAGDRADLFSSGTLATSPSGHGTEYGVAIPTLLRPADAESFVEARVRGGSDYIKIVKDDGSVFGFHRPTLDAATLSALVDAAHRRHKLAIVHIATAADAHEAIDAGADGLAHIYAGAPDARLTAAAARRGVFWTPTLVVTAQGCLATARHQPASDPRLGPYLDARARENLNASQMPDGRDPSACAAMFDAVGGLHAGGVKLLAGTDAPNPGTAHGASLHTELALLVEAGLSPLEALASATSVPARAFHLDDRGAIAPGMRADLLLVDGNPAADITATRAIVRVWKGGVEIRRDSPKIAGR